MKGYVRHLIDRYLEYKRANFSDKSEIKPQIFYLAIKREVGFQWDETPISKFDALCDFLKKRIDSTILGKKQKARGHKNYSSFDEFKAKF